MLVRRFLSSRIFALFICLFLTLFTFIAKVADSGDISSSQGQLDQSLSFQLLQEAFDKASLLSLPKDSKGLSTALIAEFHDIYLNEVQLKGFLFRSASSGWLLSSEPDLKSCCAGSPKKVLKQVSLDGNFDASLINKLVTIKGVFSIDLKKNLEGELIQVYSLKQSVLAAKDEKGIPWITLGRPACGLIGTCCIVWRVKNAKTQGLNSCRCEFDRFDEGVREKLALEGGISRDHQRQSIDARLLWFFACKGPSIAVFLKFVRTCNS